MGHSNRATLLALWVVAAFVGTSTADAFPLHECPHHDGLPHRDAAEDASHSTAHAEHSPDAAPSEHGSHDGPCTCVGQCQVTPSMAPMARQAPERLASPPLVVDRETFDRGRPFRLTIPHRLPFANGPPLSV